MRKGECRVIYKQNKMVIAMLEESQNVPTKNIWGVIIRAIITVLSAISGAFFGASIG